MNEPSCEQTCTASCAATCPSTLPTVTLAEATQRFQHEAKRGQFNTGRYRCSHFTWGNGPPLVFIHGLTASSQAFLVPIALLSHSFRCIAYDLPTGREDGAKLKRYTAIDLVDDLFGLLDHLDAKQAYVYGSGFGASIALAALHTRPDRVPRAVLHAAVDHQRLSLTERFFAWLLSHWPGSLGGVPLGRRLATATHQTSFTNCPPEVWQQFQSITEGVPARAVGRRLRLMHRLDVRPMLNSIQRPILLLTGDHDPLRNEAATQRLLDGMTGAGRIELQGCGHVPSLTHPELLARLIRLFLTPPTPCADHPHNGRVHIADCVPVSEIEGGSVRTTGSADESSTTTA